MKNKNIVHELWTFLSARKAWWLAPIVIALLLAGFLIIFGQESALSPLIYTIF